TDFVTLQRGEKRITIVPLNQILALGTRNGVIKRVRYDDWPLNQDEFEAITLRDGEKVIAAGVPGADDDQLVVITGTGQLLRVAAELVRPQGPAGSGIGGITLADQGRALSFSVASAGQLDEAVVVTFASTDDEL